MLESVFMHYTNSNLGVCITGVKSVGVLDAIAAYCRLVELRDFNKVVCSAEVLYNVAKYYTKSVNGYCKLAEANCETVFSCEIQTDYIKFSKGKDWFSTPRSLVSRSDIFEVNESQPNDLQFDEKYLESQFDSYYFWV